MTSSLFLRLFKAGRKPATAAPSSDDLEARLDAARDRAIALTPSGGDGTRSRFGGFPTLPECVAWPRQGKTGTPLHFLAEIDPAELPPTPLESGGPALPPRGRLGFFADVEEELIWDDDPGGRGGVHDPVRVLFHDAPGEIAAAPDDLPELGHAFGERAGGRAKGELAFPPTRLATRVVDSYPGVQLPSPHTPEMQRWNAAVYARIAASGVGQPGSPARLRLNQMLGAPLNYNLDADALAQAGHVLLLQLESDASVDPAAYLGCGMIQFWLKREDLAARRFERSFATWRG